MGDEARKREEQLCKQYWMGLDIPRFVNTHKSAWDIIELILRKTPLDTPEFRALLDSLPQNLPKAKPKTAWAVFAGLFGKLLGVSFRVMHGIHIIYFGVSECLIFENALLKLTT